MLGVSSDGDSRLLRAMRIASVLPTIHTVISSIPNEWREWFNGNFNPKFCCVQDTVHIATKLKTRLFKTSKILAIGNFIATKSHLDILVRDTQGSTFLIRVRFASR